MKSKLLSIPLLLCCLASNFLYAQEPDSTDNDPSSYTQPVPNTVPVFNMNTAAPSYEVQSYLEGKLSSYNAYQFDFNDLNNYLEGNPYALEFELNNGQSTTFLSLQRGDLRAPDYQETETDEDGGTIVRFTRDLYSDSDYVVRTVLGFADRTKDKICRFAIHPDDLNGYIWNTVTNQVLYYTSLQEFIKSSGDNFATTENYLLVFDLGAIIGDPTAQCLSLEQATGTPQEKGYFEDCTPRFLEIAAEGDKKWCDIYGGGAAGKILENLFFVEGIYSHNFNISFVVNHISLLPGNTTLYNSNDANQLLISLQNNWNANHPTIKRDLTILYTGRIPDNGVRGIAYVNTICNNYASYEVVSNDLKKILICAHETGHVFGSQHDNGTGGYGTSGCSGSDVPIMCASTVSNGPFFYFSPHTRGVILNSINNHAYCLNDFGNGNPINTVIKSWSNYRSQRWVATWFLQNGDRKVVGNFDGDNNDEEIFFASPNKEWVGIMDFSCDQGTDWYHLWGNSGNGTFGTWVRNYNDRYMAGDFDGNGKSDLFSVSGGASWAALQEYDPSSWSWIHKWGNAGTRWIAGWYINKNDTYTIGDFDGDGKDDLLCVNPNGWSQIIKFNWYGTYYVPQTIWSNNGNGWVGGVQIGNTNRWLKGKFTTTSRDELFTISGTWVSTQRFDGSNWQWIWSQYGANNFASMYILPLNGDQVTLAGNFDADSKDEFINLNKTWSATADYDGSTYVQNWNNGGTQHLNDWNQNEANEYLLVKAAPTANKQIFGIRYQKKSTGWGPWYNEWWEPNLCGMYRGNTPLYNFKYAPENEDGITGKQPVIKVYPNPASDAVTIECSDPGEGAEISISDLTGKVIAEHSVTQAVTRLPLQDYSNGMYILTARFKDKTTFTTKIVVHGK